MADIVRLQAIWHFSGWFLDIDMLWLREMPSCPSKSKHIFGSAQSEFPGPGRKTKDEAIRFWKLHWKRVPEEPSWLAVPFHFPLGSSLLKDILDRLDPTSFCRPQSAAMPYLTIMDLIYERLDAHGLNLDILPFDAFASVPCYMGKAVFRKDALLSEQQRYGTICRSQG